MKKKKKKEYIVTHEYYYDTGEFIASSHEEAFKKIPVELHAQMKVWMYEAVTGKPHKIAK